MSTKFWFDSAAAAAVSPSPDAEWDRTVDLQRLVLNITKGSSSRVDSGAILNEPNTMTTSNNDLLQGQHISEILDPINISSATFKCYLQARQNNAAANWRSQIIIRALAADGSSALNTLYAGDLTTLTGDPASEWNTSTSVEQNRSFPTGGSTALSDANITVPWRLCVETGARQHNTQNTNRNGAIVYGEPAGGDLPEDESSTATNLAGWIELSPTFTLYVPTTKRVIARMMMIG